MRKVDNFSDVCMHTDSCALAGAAAFFAGIPDSAVIVNGPMWCYFYALRHLEDNLPLLSERMQCTQLNNTCIVFGAEDFLRDALQPFLDNPPALLCIENNCSASLIGDDTGSIAQDMGINCPIVVFDSGGLTGGFTEGYVKAGQNLFDTLPVTGHIDMSKKRVNLLGLTTGYYNGVNDRCELEQLLNLAGYEINACPGAGTTTEQLKDITNASLNIVIHEELGLPLAEYLQKKFGMPHVSMLPPYGVMGTEEWITQINNVLPAPNFARIKSEIDRVKNSLFLRINDFKAIWGELWYDEVIIAAPMTEAYGLAKALRYEWADTGRLTVICNDSPKTLKTAEYSGYIDNAFITGKDSKSIRAVLDGFRNGLLMGSSNEDSLLRRRHKKEFGMLPVAYPVMEHLLLTELPFMGLKGAQYIQQWLWNDFVAKKLENDNRI